MTDIAVHRIDRLDLRFEPRAWPFAQDLRARIDAHFKTLQQDKPLWNGRVLLMFEHEIAGTTMRGTYLETDYASFLAWRDWDFPDKAMRNYSRLIREREGLDVLPASTAGLIALVEHHKVNPLPNDRYVVVLTGRKS